MPAALVPGGSGSNGTSMDHAQQEPQRGSQQEAEEPQREERALTQSDAEITAWLEKFTLEAERVRARVCVRVCVRKCVCV